MCRLLFAACIARAPCQRVSDMPTRKVALRRRSSGSPLAHFDVATVYRFFGERAGCAKSAGCTNIYRVGMRHPRCLSILRENRIFYARGCLSLPQRAVLSAWQYAVLYPNPSRNTCFFDKMHHFYRMFRKSVHSAFFDKNCLFPICIFYAILYSYVKRMHMYTFRKKGWRKNDENTKKIARAVRACGRAADGMLPCDPRLPFVCVALRSANGRRSVCPFFPFGAVARRCDCRSAFARRRTFV